MSPRPPSITLRARHRQEAETPKKARFFHAVDQARESGKLLIRVYKEEEVSHNTGFRWLRQREEFGARRSGKIRSGRPRKITERQLQILINPNTNPVRDQILDC